MARAAMVVLMLLLFAPLPLGAGAPEVAGATPETARQAPGAQLFDPRRPPEAELQLGVGDGFTLAAVGDCIMSRPLSAMLKSDEAFAAIARVVRETSATFGNLETSIVDVRTTRGDPEGGSDDWTLTADPGVVVDLKTLGFDLLSRANNHALDWGIEGMRETSRRLDEAGLVHAGVGENRAEARAARYLETEKGRIALVSMVSTFREYSAALPPSGQAPGRPGVDALRTTRTTIVPEPVMRALRDLKATLDAGLVKCEGKPSGPPELAMKPFEAPLKPQELSLFDMRFRPGERAGYHYDIDPQDLAEILKAIRAGKQHSDFLIATIHAHETGVECEEPGDFLPVLAHASIDAGASAFLVHGSHYLGPIEIYKGRLVAYGLGNFFWSDIQEPQPANLYEQNRDLLKSAFGDPSKATDADMNALLNATSFNDELFFQSIVVVSRYDGGRLSEVRLYPVDLGYGMRLTKSGVPRLAAAPVARTILDRLQRLSQPYGTAIAIEKGVGVIRPR